MDFYTRTILTVIAVALTVIATGRTSRTAVAESASCGSMDNPCAVYNVIYDSNAFKWKRCFEENQPCFSISTKK
jgi:hypothetical protein